MGVGTNKKNIDEWVDDIFNAYVKRDDGLLRKDEFVRFVKQTFKTTGSPYQPTDTDLHALFQMLNLVQGKADKPCMYLFLKDLAYVRPPYYDMIEPETDEEIQPVKMKELVKK